MPDCCSSGLFLPSLPTGDNISHLETKTTSAREATKTLINQLLDSQQQQRQQLRVEDESAMPCSPHQAPFSAGLQSDKRQHPLHMRNTLAAFDLHALLLFLVATSLGLILLSPLLLMRAPPKGPMLSRNIVHLDSYPLVTRDETGNKGLPSVKIDDLLPQPVTCSDNTCYSHAATPGIGLRKSGSNTVLTQPSLILSYPRVFALNFSSDLRTPFLKVLQAR